MPKPKPARISDRWRRRWTVIVCTAFALPPLWMLAVDRSWFMEDCPDCGLARDVFQDRAFTIPVRERIVDDETLPQMVARDLGVPCEHPRMPATRWHKHRRWGLIYCKAPCWNGLFRLTSDMSWYGPAESARVAALAEAEPDLPAEFARRLREPEFWQRPDDVAFYHAILDRADVHAPERPGEDG